jgi:hypothetical protein
VRSASASDQRAAWPPPGAARPGPRHTRQPGTWRLATVSGTYHRRRRLHPALPQAEWRAGGHVPDDARIFLLLPHRLECRAAPGEPQLPGSCLGRWLQRQATLHHRPDARQAHSTWAPQMGCWCSNHSSPGAGCSAARVGRATQAHGRARCCLPPAGGEPPGRLPTADSEVCSRAGSVPAVLCHSLHGDVDHLACG